MSGEHADWVGRVVADGRFQITRKLGEGGMGYVYQAYDGVLQTDVVIKVPRRAMLEDPEFKARFARENQALVQLQHPNIVNILFVGEDEGLPYAVMQFLSGGDLKARQLQAGGGRVVPLDPMDLVNWLPGIAKALDFIHARGFIHRDVKPANILFDGYNNVYLSDFGVAKAVAEKQTNPRTQLTGTGMVMGTPEYMAPELIMDEDFDGRIDQYALAISVYEVLCGRTPFEGSQSQAILVKQVNEPVPDITTIVPHVTQELSHAVMQGLAKNPGSRYVSCVAFSDSVLATLGGGGSVSSPPRSATPHAGVADDGTATHPSGTTRIQPGPSGETKAIAAEATSSIPALKEARKKPALSPEQRKQRTSLFALWGTLLMLSAMFVALLPAVEPNPENANANETENSLSEEEKYLAIPLAQAHPTLDFETPLGLTMKCISPGRTNDKSPDDPKTTIIHEPFWLAETEVTVAQYLAYVKDVGPSEGLLPEWLDDNNPQFLEKPGSAYASFAETVQRNGVPIVGLTPTQMTKFCDWLTNQPGEVMRYQLPTRAQWLVAYRAGTETDYSWGADFQPNQCITTIANDEASLANAKSPFLNPWKFYGMAGNACEVLDSKTEVAGGHWRTTKPIEHSIHSVRSLPVDRSLVGFRVVAVPKPDASTTPSP